MLHPQKKASADPIRVLKLKYHLHYICARAAGLSPLHQQNIDCGLKREYVLRNSHSLQPQQFLRCLLAEFPGGRIHYLVLKENMGETSFTQSPSFTILRSAISCQFQSRSRVPWATLLEGTYKRKVTGTRHNFLPPHATK